MAPALEADLPEVEHAVRLRERGGLVYRDGEPTVEAEVYFADPSVFDVFSFPLLRGDPARALAEPNTVVLTEQLAARVFGAEDPVGRVVRLRDEDLRVTGVMADVPPTSHVRFDALASYATRQEEWLQNWGTNTLWTYVLLREGATRAAVDARIAALAVAHRGEEGAEGITYYLQPLTDIHFRTDLVAENAVVGDVAVVYVFSAVALFILLIASINYVNLATARSMQRMREVGVRKALGARRAQLVRQFLGESLLMAAAALALGVGLAALALPLFNRLLELELSFEAVSLAAGLGALAAVFLLVGVLAGVYPALHLSGFRPIAVLKGALPTLGGGGGFRRVLVVVQFTVSVGLIAAVGVAYQQLRFVQQTHLGFDEAHLVSLEVDDAGQADRLRRAAAALPQVVRAAASEQPLGNPFSQTTMYAEGASEDESLLLSVLLADPDFAPTAGIALAAGRGFAWGRASDSTGAVVLNETAVRALGWPSAEAAVGRRLLDGEEALEVIGVVRDFHFASLHQPIEPLMLLWSPSPLDVVTARLRPGDVAGALGALEAAWARVGPDRPFDYAFVDERLDRLYASDRKLGLLFGVFALLAVGIACLGLFGLAAYTAERRTKEIGVRKVMGASVASLAGLLSKDFLKLVLVAAVLAVPLAYLAMRRWLEAFAYHVEIGPGVFVAAGALALGIALLTVSTQALRAASTDPVKALRYE
jgi:putative ABC transport system permease protein